MVQNTDFVGLDVGKFEIFVYVSKTGAAFSVPNTPAGHSSLQRKLGGAFSVPEIIGGVKSGTGKSRKNVPPVYCATNILEYRSRLIPSS